MKRPVTLPMIEQFLRVTGMGPTRFGLQAVNDGKLVPSLRQGGELGPKRQITVARFIKDHVRATRKQADKLEDLFQ